MSTRQPPVRRPAPRAPVLPLLLVALAAAPPPASAQAGSAMSRLERLETERIELDGLTVVHSSTGQARTGAEARRTGTFFSDAVRFYADRFGEGLHVVVAVLDPGDFAAVSGGRYAMPFSAPAEGLVVVPARTAGFALQPGQDSTLARRMLDLIRLHELGHPVAAAYLRPAGFVDDRAPVRWFEELIASYLAHAFMRETMPGLADFAEKLASEAIDTGAPHFASLEAYERYYDGYTATPQGAATLGWFHNVFNRRAAELYDEYGLDFFRQIRRRLPWMRYELWTTESLLRDLDAIAPGFLAWAEEIEYFGGRR